MKKNISILLLLALIIGTCTFTACHKPEIQQPNNPPVVGTLPKVTKEFFAQPWQRSANGFEILYKSTRITQEQIGSGFDVTVAVIGAGEGPWIKLPAIYADANITDTVRLSFQVAPGELKISAQTNFNLTNHSADVQIDYQ